MSCEAWLTIGLYLGQLGEMQDPTYLAELVSG